MRSCSAVRQPSRNSAVRSSVHTPPASLRDRIFVPCVMEFSSPFSPSSASRASSTHCTLLVPSASVSCIGTCASSGIVSQVRLSVTSSVPSSAGT